MTLGLNQIVERMIRSPMPAKSPGGEHHFAQPPRVNIPASRAMEHVWGYTVRVRNGRIAYFRAHYDAAEAVAAAQNAQR